MKKIYVCSPLKGDIMNNVRKAQLYSKFVASLGHIPYTPHIYFTIFFDDTKEEERCTCMKLALEWLVQCDELWFFGDKITEGMKGEIDLAKKLGIETKAINSEAIEAFLLKKN
jgi:hypothetical protein